MEHNNDKTKNEYYLTYYNTHKDEFRKKIWCDLCLCNYMKYNKTNHENTKKHKNAVSIKKLEEELITLIKVLSKVHIPHQGHVLMENVV